MLNNKKYTVLIVDDDPVTTAMLGSLCTSYGLNVITDTDAERALQRVADGQAQIVISDWHMQGMNGLQFCERIRSLPVGDFVYFILMSAYSEDEFIRDCILSQVDQFLPKPIESQLLRHSLFNAFRILDLKDSLGSLDLELPEQQKTLQQDLQLLRLLQLSMMPQRNQVLSGTRIHTYSKPRAALSGDHCGVFRLNDDTIGFYIVDVVGHGMPAAIRAMGAARLLSSSPYESVVYKDRENPDDALEIRGCAEVMTVLNTIYQISDEDQAYVCGLYGKFNRITGELEVSVAGMPLPYLVSELGEVELLGQSDLPLGIQDTQQYRSVRRTLRPGDKLVMISDGLVEIRNPAGEVLGLEQFNGLLAGCVKTATDNLLDCVVGGVLKWADRQESKEFQDDVTLMLLDFYPEPARPAVQGEKRPVAEPLPKPRARRLGWPWAGIQSDAEVNKAGQALSEFNLRKCLVVSGENTMVDALLQGLQAMHLSVERVAQDYFLNADDPILNGVDVVFIHAQDGSSKAAKWVQIIRDAMDDHPPYIVLCFDQLKLKQASDLIKLGGDNFLQAPVRPERLSFLMETINRQHTLRQNVRRRTRELKSLRHELKQDLLAVSRMQAATLPKPFPDLKHLKFDWVFKPAESVSGDFLGVMKITRSVIGFYAIDGAGQGVLALIKGWQVARLLAGVQRSKAPSSFQAISGLSGHRVLKSPAAVLKGLNERLLAMPSAYGMRCSLVYGTLDCETGRGMIAIAGHPIPVISRQDGTLTALGHQGPAAGESSGHDYVDVAFVLRPGDRLNLFSDGLVQMLGAPNSGAAQPLEQVHALLSTLGRHPLPDSKALWDSRLDMIEAAEPKDVSLLMLELGESKPIRSREVSVTEWVDRFQPLLEGMAAQHALPGKGKVFDTHYNESALHSLVQQVRDWLLVEYVHELAAIDRLAHLIVELGWNIQRQPRLFSGEIRMEVAVVDLGAQWLVVIHDNGRTITNEELDRASSMAVDDTDHHDSEGTQLGMGLIMAMNLSDDMRYHAGHHNNTFVAVQSKN